MTTQHTPGRLNVKHMVGIYREDGCLVASVHTPVSQNGSANARRLVACWNACMVIPIEALEAYPAIVPNGLKAIRHVEAQRDELLEALKEIVENTNDGGAHSCAIAAIQKVEGK